MGWPFVESSGSIARKRGLDDAPGGRGRDDTGVGGGGGGGGGLNCHCLTFFCHYYLDSFILTCAGFLLIHVDSPGGGIATRWRIHTTLESRSCSRRRLQRRGGSSLMASSSTTLAPPLTFKSTRQRVDLLEELPLSIIRPELVPPSLLLLLLLRLRLRLGRAMLPITKRPPHRAQSPSANADPHTSCETIGTASSSTAAVLHPLPRHDDRPPALPRRRSL